MSKIKLAAYLCFTLITTSLMGNLNIQTAVSATTANSVSGWESFGPTGNNVFASVQISGIWGLSQALANPSTYPSNIRVAINASNQMVAVWIGNDILTGTQALYAAVYNTLAGTWTTSIISVPAIEYVIGNHQVSVAANGTVVVTWASYILSSQLNLTRTIYAPVFGTWPLPVTVL